MPQLPEHVVKNREVWTGYAADYVHAGRKAWESPDIYWGIWSIPEAIVGAFGDLSQLSGLDTIELGCGTAYFSAWMAKFGARPVGIDVTPAQLDTARLFQKEFGIEFPLLEASAEAVPLGDSGFDLAFSEYGASIWCDPAAWIKEAARLLRPGGRLVFMRNTTLSTLCTPDQGPAKETLVRPQFGLYRIDWEDGGAEFQPPTGELIRILRSNGFDIDALKELQAPDDGMTRYDFMTLEWARRWPCEEVWIATKGGR